MFIALDDVRWIVMFNVLKFVFLPQTSHPFHHIPPPDILCVCEEESIHLHSGNGTGFGNGSHDFLKVRRIL